MALPINIDLLLPVKAAGCEWIATGIPKIKKSLQDNGSPAPVFETDDDRTYFKTTIKIHPGFFVPGQGRTQESVQVSVQANFFIINNLDEILNSLDTLDVKESDYVKEQVREQVEAQVMEYTLPEKLKSPNQKYVTTEKGNGLLKIFGNN